MKAPDASWRTRIGRTSGACARSPTKWSGLPGRPKARSTPSAASASTTAAQGVRRGSIAMACILVSAHPGAAVDVDGGAGDEVGIRGGEEDRDSRHVLGGLEPP